MLGQRANANIPEFDSRAVSEKSDVAAAAGKPRMPSQKRRIGYPTAISA